MRRFTLIALLLAGLGFVAGRVITGLADNGAAEPQSAPANGRQVTAPAAASATGSLPDFTRIAERTVPAVASISARQIVRRQPSRIFRASAEWNGCRYLKWS